MKLNFDCIAEVLAKVKERPSATFAYSLAEPDELATKFGCNALLNALSFCHQIGLFTFAKQYNATYYVEDLTFKGHLLLRKIEDDPNWDSLISDPTFDVDSYLKSRDVNIQPVFNIQNANNAIIGTQQNATINVGYSLAA